MCCFISITHAQTIAPTTDEEYTMGLVGYKMFLQMGVELKQGYKVNHLQSMNMLIVRLPSKDYFVRGSRNHVQLL